MDSILGKAFFCTFQLIFYAVRPITLYRVPFTRIHLLNVVVQALFDYMIAALLPGLFTLRSLQYFWLSSLLAGSLHPMGAQFIAEHYVFETVSPEARDPANGLPVPETFSYYGSLNFLMYNVGLHNEHHDFPAVPWTRLPVLHDIAREFYDPLPHHRSWTYALVRFILDDRVGMRCRVKRRSGGRIVGGGSVVAKPATDMASGCKEQDKA